MLRRFRENHYRKSVRRTVSRLSGIPERMISLGEMPKNDTEFEELVMITKDWVKRLSLTKKA